MGELLAITRKMHHPTSYMREEITGNTSITRVTYDIKDLQLCIKEKVETEREKESEKRSITGLRWDGVVVYKGNRNKP